MNRRDFFKRSATATAAATVMPSAAKTPKDSADIKRFVGSDGSVVVDWVDKSIGVKGEMEFNEFHAQIDRYLHSGLGLDSENPYWLATNCNIQLEKDWIITNPNGLLNCCLCSEYYVSYKFLSHDDLSKIKIFINGGIIEPNRSGILITDFVPHTIFPAEIIAVRERTVTRFMAEEKFTPIIVPV